MPTLSLSQVGVRETPTNPGETRMILYHDDKTGYTTTESETLEALLAECRQDDPTLQIDSDTTVPTDAGPVRVIAGTMCDCEFKLLEGSEYALEAYDPDSIAMLD